MIAANSNLPILSRGQLEYVRKRIQHLPPQSRQRNVHDAFLLMMCRVRNTSGAVLMSRKQMAAELGISPRRLSTVMTTLENIGVVRRERKGLFVTYFIDEKVAWEKLPGEE
jgi:DNA-binding transcriptional regulator YhcF (GntR family)